LSFQLAHHLQAAEQQLELWSVDKCKIPSIKTIENVVHTFVSMIPEEEEKERTAF
jgi:hypothetical protein